MTTDKETLGKLLQDVRAATGPDRRLDIAIHVLITNEGRLGDYASVDEYTNTAIQLGWNTPRVTASIDAALAVTERVLPGHRFAMFTDGGGKGPSCIVCIEDDPVVASERAPTLPLAILGAGLATLISQVKP